MEKAKASADCKKEREEMTRCSMLTGSETKIRKWVLLSSQEA